MAHSVLDLNIQAGYPFDLDVDFNDSAGTDLETSYSCYFECDSIGQLQFSVNGTSDGYELTISKENTDLLTTNLEEYVVYAIRTSDSKYEKLLQGRIHVVDKVRT